MHRKVDISKLHLNKIFQNICRRKFYGHPHGCPNYGKKPGCPPFAPLLSEVLDLTQPVYVIYTEFALGQFAERMRLTHPAWQEHPRQWYNPRRWQPTARKMHRQDIAEFKRDHPETFIIASPEANGVNLTEVMQSIGITLSWQWPPEHKKDNVTYVITMAGTALPPKS